MPQFIVTLPDGREMAVEAASQPTPEEVLAFLGEDQSPSVMDERSWTDTAVDALPMVGGTVGGLVGAAGGPAGALGGAALGGAGGEGFRQAINAVRGEGPLLSAPRAINEMSMAAGQQGAYEAGGRAFGGALNKLGTKFYSSAVKAPAETLTQVPGAMARGAREGILSPDRAKRLTDTARQKVDDLLAVEEAAGTPGVSSNDVVRGLAGKPREAAQRRVQLGAPDETPYLAKRAADIHKANKGGDIPLTRANALKREAQDLAYESGTANLAIHKQADESIAEGLKKAIEARVPKVGPLNQTTREYLALLEALETARANWDKSNPLLMPLLAGSALGGGSALLTGDPSASVGTGLLTGVLASPSGRARAGIALSNIGRRQIGPQIVRGTSAGITGVRRRTKDDD